MIPKGLSLDRVPRNEHLLYAHFSLALVRQKAIYPEYTSTIQNKSQTICSFGTWNQHQSFDKQFYDCADDLLLALRF